MQLVTPSEVAIAVRMLIAGAEQEREVAQVAQSDLLALEQHLSHAVHSHVEDGADVSS